jgi:hypothetical protein
MAVLRFCKPAATRSGEVWINRFPWLMLAAELRPVAVAVARSLIVISLCAAYGDDLLVSTIGIFAMNAIKIAALVLIAAGVLGLVYGSFSYTKETTEAKLGPIELTLKDKETIDIPVWAGVGAIVIGGALLLFGNKK